MDVSERLARLDTCALSDALNRLGHEGVITGPVPLTGLAKVYGRAVTVELGPPGEQTPARHLGTAAVMQAEPGDIILVAHQSRTDCAGWGGNLSRAALARGVAAVIVDGAVRDVDEAAQIGLTVLATAATPRTARGRTVEHAWGGTVTVGGTEVATGDWLVCDGSGVVAVPARLLEDVLDVAEEIADKEAAMAAAIAAGTPVDQVMGHGYERMLHQ
jgi:4-hydroxy-4-methyl-2-oxoglutarate aldolase